jgi:hypothetical protein
MKEIKENNAHTEEQSDISAISFISAGLKKRRHSKILYHYEFFQKHSRRENR